MKKFGILVDRSLIVKLPAGARSFDENTSIVAVTSIRRSERLRAVTTMSLVAVGVSAAGFSGTGDAVAWAIAACGSRATVPARSMAFVYIRMFVLPYFFNSAGF